MVESCLLSLWSKLHPCRASFSFLQSKPLILVEQVSHSCRASFLRRGGQVWAFVLSGAHAKDGLYLLWACGHGTIGLANGPIELAKSCLIFYPLHMVSSIYECYMLVIFSNFKVKRKSAFGICTIELHI